jgi:hypothetical protein
MKTYGLPILLVCILLAPVSGFAQKKKTRTMTGSAAKAGSTANLKVTPDLDKRLAKLADTSRAFTGGRAIRML